MVVEMRIVMKTVSVSASPSTLPHFLHLINAAPSVLDVHPLGTGPKVVSVPVWSHGDGHDGLLGGDESETDR